MPRVEPASVPVVVYMIRPRGQLRVICTDQNDPNKDIANGWDYLIMQYREQPLCIVPSKSARENVCPP
jgi:hypothetical protein